MTHTKTDTTTPCVLQRVGFKIVSIAAMDTKRDKKKLFYMFGVLYFV